MNSRNAKQMKGLTDTALQCMVARSNSGYPYAKEFYDAYIKQYKFVNIFGVDTRKDKLAPKGTPDLRTERTMESIGKTGITQILELGAGMSTQGFAYCKDNPHATYVEVLYKNEKQGIDESKIKTDTLEHMKHKVGGIPDNLHIYGGDILDEEIFGTVAKHFDCNKPVVVTHSGVLMYHPDIEKEKLAVNIKNFLAEFGGKWISPDFTTHKFSTACMQELSDEVGGLYPFASQEEIIKFFEKVDLSPSFLATDDVKQKLKSCNGEYCKDNYNYVKVDINKTEK